MVLLDGGPIIKSGDGEPADLGDQEVRVALLQVEAHFRSNHTYSITIIYTNIITWLKMAICCQRAPFSYLTLFCLIVNEISGPKRVTHHIFYLVQKIAVVQRKKES